MEREQIAINGILLESNVLAQYRLRSLDDDDLFSSNLYFVQMLWNFNSFIGMFFYAYLLALLLLFLETEKVHLIVKNFLIILAPLNLILSSFSIRPAIIQTYSIPFGDLRGIAWRNSLPFSSLLFAGGGIILLFIIFVPLIAKKTFSLKTPFERKKGMLIVLGITGIFLAGIEAWFVGPMVENSFWKDISHGILCASGQIFFGLGMLLKKK